VLVFPYLLDLDFDRFRQLKLVHAMTKEGIEQAKERLAQALQGIKDLVKAKEDAKQDVDTFACSIPSLVIALLMSL
jgi:hypothetical protein